MRPRKLSDEELLEIARECILEHGPTISTEEIAKRAGVSQATIFKRFGTKMELLHMCLTNVLGVETVLKVMEDPPSDGCVQGQLEKRCLTLYHFYEEMVPRWATWHMLQQMNTNRELPARSPPMRAKVGLTQWMSVLQEQGRIDRHVQVDSMAIAILGAIQMRPVR